MNVLIIDDEKSQHDSLAGFLRKEGHSVDTAASGTEGLELIAKKVVDVVLTDYRMPDLTGLDVLKKAKMLNPTIDVVLITAFGTIETAVEAMRSGAFDYLTKPVDLDELELILAKIQEHRHLVSENEHLREQLSERYQLHNLVYQSQEMVEVASQVARVAPSRATVLIRGESGTGKEVLARAIHYASPRQAKNMIAVNCAALSDTVLESELFGHEKGSFTGADYQRIGRFEQAHLGTLFLDEIGDIPLTTQVKLLRVLQERTIERVGGNRTIMVDVRLIAATNRDLEAMIRAGTFREDLFFRLNVMTINLPALRHRREDIPLLLDRFLAKFGAENGRGSMEFSKEAYDRLIKYDYPGNIRELENIVEQTVVMARHNTIVLADLPAALRPLPHESPLPIADLNGPFPEKVAAFEQMLIRQALEETDGIQRRAADVLGITERNLRYKLHKYGMK